MKRVLALDVAYTNIGWAIIEPFNNVDRVIAVGDLKNPCDTKKKKTVRASSMMVDRVTLQYTQLREIYLKYKPSGIVAELPVGGGKSSKAAEGMALGTAIVSILVAQFNIPAEWTTPEDGKVAMCRSKTASKFDMQAEAMVKFPELREMVPTSTRSKTGFEAWFEHSADACAAFLSAKHGTLVRYIADDNGKYDPGYLF